MIYFVKFKWVEPNSDSAVSVLLFLLQFTEGELQIPALFI